MEQVFTSELDALNSIHALLLDIKNLSINIEYVARHMLVYALALFGVLIAWKMLRSHIF